MLSTALSRLEPDGVMLVIMTHWHEDDIGGRIARGVTWRWTRTTRSRGRSSSCRRLHRGRARVALIVPRSPEFLTSY